MVLQNLIDRVHGLSDLELAVLLSLIAKEHCIIETDEDAVDEVEQELQLAISNIFGLSFSVINCSQQTTIEEFTNSLLAGPRTSDVRRSYSHEDTNERAAGIHFRLGHQSRRKIPISPIYDMGLDDRKLVNVVIAKNFDLTSENVQIQALELIRTQRIFTRTAFHSAPKEFLFIPLLPTGGSNPRLNLHFLKYIIQNDHIFISHYHDPEDGFPNLEEDSGWLSDDKASLSSVKKRKSKSVAAGTQREECTIHQDEVDLIRQLRDEIYMSTEIKQYLQNITVFLRLNRAVSSGITSRATTHFDLLVKCLAPLHSLQYVTPSLVLLAARKIYPHRIKIVSPQNERSLQYGSDIRAITALLQDATPESVIEEVLASVEAPL